MSIWWLVLVWIIAIIVLVVALTRRDRRTQGLDGFSGQWLDIRPTRLTQHEVLPFIACYVLYILFVGLSIGVFLSWKSVLIAVLAAFFEDIKYLPFIYVSCWLLLGLLFGVGTLSAERYFREGVPQHQLLRRFAIACLTVFVFGGFGFILREIALGMLAGH